MRKSRLKKSIQERLIEHFIAGTTARCAASLVGVNKNTSAYYFHRLREIIANAGFASASDITTSEWGMQDEGRASYDAYELADEIRAIMQTATA